MTFDLVFPYMHSHAYTTMPPHTLPCLHMLCSPGRSCTRAKEGKNGAIENRRVICCLSGFNRGSSYLMYCVFISLSIYLSLYSSCSSSCLPLFLSYPNLAYSSFLLRLDPRMEDGQSFYSSNVINDLELIGCNK